ncbi:MAG: right-handed parallel beta-helix repeat-containing protein [Akkermansiaceae bacterium]|jgi:parallel beta-helix repeat protein|nr:right-handed parallel beta-helix repeat-containing protein [Akkermansiaceae bacterium]
MTLTEARKILGLGPDEDPRPYLAEFESARERIAEMVRTAPNEVLGARYQEGLVEFDQAMAAVHEYLQALGLMPRPTDGPKPLEEAPEIFLASEKPAKPRSRTPARLAWAAVILTAVAGGGLLHYKQKESAEIQRQIRVTFLERVGSEYVENRRWQEAAAAFAEIEELAPGSELAKLGRRSIEAGMTEEQTQFVGYWTGQAIAELESGRLDEAEAASRKVLEKFPAEKEAAAILAKVAEARVGQSLETALVAARQLLNDRKWPLAIEAANRILATHPEDAGAKTILADAAAALAKYEADEARAKDLLAQAAALDTGNFDQKALDLLREAAALSPGNQEIASRLEKMASYTRTLRVPGDFASPAEAIEASRDGDRIVIAEEVWKGPLVINAAIELQGAGSGKTFIECHADSGSAITIGPQAKGARITGISFRHESFQAVGNDRFSAALVRGGGAIFVDCHFTDASGHGLAVIEGGEAVATRCRFQSNGWNGAAAIGKGSLIEVRDSEAIENFEHGIETWDGASAVLANNRCEGNSRNGIHIDNQAASATLEGNQLIANREFGLVLDSAANGKVSGNIARANLLGGFVVRTDASALPFTGNQATLNQGPGLVLEKGLAPDAYASNKATKNATKDILADATLAQPEEHSAVPTEETRR